MKGDSKMKRYILGFEDIVKYEVEVYAESKEDAIEKVNSMLIDEHHDFEVDRNEHTPTKIIDKK